MRRGEIDLQGGCIGSRFNLGYSNTIQISWLLGNRWRSCVNMASSPFIVFNFIDVLKTKDWILYVKRRRLEIGKAVLFLLIS